MNDVIRMQFRQSTCYLVYNRRHLLSRQMNIVLINSLMQIPTLNILHNQVDFIILYNLEMVNQLHNIRVFYLIQYL